MGDFLKNVLGIGDNVKHFVTQTIPTWWGQAEDELKKKLAPPVQAPLPPAKPLQMNPLSNAFLKPTTPQTPSPVAPPAFLSTPDPVKRAPAPSIAQLVGGMATGDRNLLPTVQNDAGFFNAPVSTTAKGAYNLGASIVNSIGTEGVIKPINDLVGGVGAVAQGKPLQFKSGAFKLGQDLTNGEGAQKLLADAAATALPIIYAWTGGTAKTALESKAIAEVIAGKFGAEMQREALKKVAIESAKTGGKIGASFGAAQGLIDNQDKPLPQDLVNMALSTVVGGAAGAAIGAVTPYAGKKLSDTIEAFKKGDLQVGNSIVAVKPDENGNFPSGSFSAMFDKQARLEISDKLAKIDKEKIGYQVPLGDILDHPALFEKYPWLKEIKVTKEAGNTSSFDGSNIAIGASDKDKKGALLHEIQHAIQEHEGFATGGSPSGMNSILMPEVKAMLEMSSKLRSTNPEKAMELFRKARELERTLSTDSKAFDAYQKLAGEVEARTVASRKNMSSGQLSRTPPYVDQGVPVDQMITKFDKSTAELAPRVFERAKGLTPEGQKIEQAAFDKITADEPALVDTYTRDLAGPYHNIANADEARKLFSDVGYAGSNAADVQEPASYMNKVLWRKFLENPQDQATLYAGGSGSGKSSAIDGIFPNLQRENAAILDGNLSSIGSALERVKEAEAAGKKVHLIYSYREPVESLVNGVIKRMLKNEKEGGRLVPVSVVAKNHKGSWDVIDTLYQMFRQRGKEDAFAFIDNSRGPGGAIEMNYDQFRMIKFPDDLEQRMAAEVERLAALGPENGGISALQKEKLLEGYTGGSTAPASEAAPLANTPRGASGMAPKSAQDIISEVQAGTHTTKAPNGLPGASSVAPGADKKLADLGLNTAHLNISDQAKGTIDQAMGELKPTLEKTVGAVMTKEEIAKAAESTAASLKKTLTRDEVVRIGAQAENLRSEIAHLAETSNGQVTPELIDALKRDKEFSSGTARLLQQRGNMVDPAEKSDMLKMIELVNAKVNDIDAVLAAAKGVDFNNANESAMFYRQFIKPKVEDWIDILRYNSMLTSPLTHIVNIGSNLINSGAIAPLEKTVAGGFDFLGSAITGRERKQFAGEGAQFLKGYASNIGEAAHRFAGVMSGERSFTNLDTRIIPLSPGSTTEEVLKFPLKLLEAADQFFTALTEGGETAALTYRQGKGVVVKDLAQKAKDAASYRLYRQDLHASGQGTLLNAIDDLTGMVMKARNSQNPIVRGIAKWTVPFIKTPMNIFKQGIEYSPVGFATLHGAENKVDQIAKAAIGSSIFAGAAMLLGSDRLTWAMPISEKEKNAFLAAGKQPYSVKVGDTWVSYQKMPPGIAFSLALVAAIDDTQKNAKLGDDAVDQILTAVAKYGQFLSDQSYAKSMGDLLTAAKGGESGITRLLGNYPQQLVPFRAFGGWLARIADDTQRKIDPKAGFIDKQVQLLMQNIPGLSQSTPARVDQFGNEIKASHNLINAVNPFKISTENPDAAAQYDAMMGEKRSAAEAKQLKDQLANGGSIGDAKNKSEALKALGKTGDYIFAYGLEKYTKPNEESGIKKYTFETDKATTARQIMEGTDKYKDIPEELKPEIYKAMGLDQHDVEYDFMASQPTLAVAQFLGEEMRAANLDHNSVVRALVNGRRTSISGKMMVSNAVVDEMYKNGFITKSEQTALKKVKLGQNGENQSAVAGSPRKASVSALVTALKNIPKVGGADAPKAASKGGGFSIPKMRSVDTNLSTPVQKVEPLTLAQIFQGSQVSPLANTNIAKAKAMVAASGRAAPGTGLKLSQSFYRGR